MEGDLFLEFLEDKQFHRRPWKPTHTSSIGQLIILKERLRGNQLPPAILLELPYDFLIPELAHVAEAGREHDVATLFAWEEHFFEEEIVHMIAVDQATACHEVIFVLVVHRELLGVAQLVLK